MIKGLKKLGKLKDKSLQVPWLGKLFDFSKIRRLFHFPSAMHGLSVRGFGKTDILRLFHYKQDILCILLVVCIAFLFARNPGMDLNSPPATSDTQAVTLKPPETREELGIVRKVEQVKELKTRNIFNATGVYTDTDATNRPLPEKPYNLIGVLYGKEMKAVFSEYTGSVVTMTVGNKMIDGFVISKIKSTSVKLKRGNEEKELKTFDVRNPEQTIEKKMADGSVIIINKGISPAKLKEGAEERKRERTAVDNSSRERAAGQKTVDRTVKERTSGKLREAEDQEEIRRRERDVQMRQQTIPRKP